jgi:large subunit ribosomal protein L9
MAIPLTRANKRQIEALRQRRAEREAHEFNTMTELAKALSKLICVLKTKAGDDGKMFGSVTAGMIADELKHQFDISLDKRKIHLEHPIRALGEYEVELNLHAEVKGVLKVRVESTTPVAAPAPETATAVLAEAKTEDGKRPRTEKRGFIRRDARGDRPPRPEKAQKAETAEVNPPRAAKGEKGEKPAKSTKTTRAQKGETKAEKEA